MQDAPYLLEPLADAFPSEDVRVRLALLTAGMQLFFKRPPETQVLERQHSVSCYIRLHVCPLCDHVYAPWMQPLLGSLLSAGVADTQQDVHDRALLYYRQVLSC